MLLFLFRLGVGVGAARAVGGDFILSLSKTELRKVSIFFSLAQAMASELDALLAEISRAEDASKAREADEAAVSTSEMKGRKRTSKEVK